MEQNAVGNQTPESKEKTFWPFPLARLVTPKTPKPDNGLIGAYQAFRLSSPRPGLAWPGLHKAWPGPFGAWPEAYQAGLAR